MSIYDYKFKIGKTEYEVDMEGYIESGERPSSDSTGSPETFIAEKTVVYPMELIDFVDDIRDLHFNWEMLWLEPEASTEECISKWDPKCFEAFIELLKRGIREEMLSGIIGSTVTKESVNRLFTQLQNEEPSLFVDYTIGKFLTTVKESYFPKGGKKLEAEIYTDIEENILDRDDPRDSRDDDSDYSYF